ncbi:MAG: ligase-associated DNA damage response endonuclease PdeM [Hyphomicrobiaceae bacterium]
MTAVPARTRGSSDFTRQPVSLAGTEFLADASGALWWPGERTLIVSDLHLEKGSAHAMRGLMLPPYDTRETLARLATIIERYAPRTVIALGDSFHDMAAEQRLQTGSRSTIADLQRGREWIWIAGNHDPAIPASLGGTAASTVVRGRMTFCHEPGPHADSSEIVGHFHPVARAELRAGSLRRRCFATDSRRLVLPAFGAFTGGLNVLDAAFETVLAAERLRVLLLGDDGVYPVATSCLRPD